MATTTRPRLPDLPDALAECCSPVTGAALETTAAEALARVFRALGDPTRVRLLSLIAAHADGEACVCDLTDPVGLSQPTVSHHLKQLVEAGLITREQRGKWAYYRVEQSAQDSLGDTLRRLISTGR
jgi:ArsR family transcriptional regulator, arsenate/arsenite/antimonite-responsive transcriptional repressor